MKFGKHWRNVLAIDLWCSRLIVIMAVRAKTFWTRCNLLRLEEDIPYSIELQ